MTTHYSNWWTTYCKTLSKQLIAVCKANVTTLFKKRTHKTGWYNFIEIGPLWMIFHRMHRHLIADWSRLLSSIWVECHLCGFHGNNSTIQERVYEKPICYVAELKLPALAADFEQTIVDRPVSRLRDSIWNSCWNLYFRFLLFALTQNFRR